MYVRMRYWTFHVPQQEEAAGNPGNRELRDDLESTVGRAAVHHRNVEVRDANRGHLGGAAYGGHLEMLANERECDRE